MALLCFYCGAPITSKKVRIVHINVCQEPSIKNFCNRDCKLNWVFKKSVSKVENYVNRNRSKKEAKFTSNSAIIEDKLDELEEYLKENNLRILRDA